LSSEPLLALGVLAIVVLGAAGATLLWHRRRVQLRRRQERWRELCLRLELAPRPGHARVAKGELQNTDYFLHDTGSDWLLELPLAQPLLPSDMVLLSSEAPMLPPRVRMRALEWEAASLAPGMRAWSVKLEESSSDKVQAPQAFAEAAARAMQAHAPLRVEPQRFIQALRLGDQLSATAVREAVRGLHATARGWLEVAERQGLPRIQALPEPQPEPQAPPPLPEPQLPPPLPGAMQEQAPQASEPPPPKEPKPEYAWEQPPWTSPPPEVQPMPEYPWEQYPRLKREFLDWLGGLLKGPAAYAKGAWVRHEVLRVLVLLNAGVPICLALMLLPPEREVGLVVLGGVLMAGALWVQAGSFTGRYNRWQLTLWWMMVSTTIFAPCAWGFKRQQLALILWGVPNVLGLGWVLVRWLRKRLGGS
jgi:hypothetical protein